MGRLTKVEAVRYDKLADVVEALYGTFGKVTGDGLLIEQAKYPLGNRVKYTDTANPDAEPIEMSSQAYAAEFFKACGGDLQSADFDKVVRECNWVGDMLGNILLSRGIVTFDDLRTGVTNG